MFSMSKDFGFDFVCSHHQHVHINGDMEACRCRPYDIRSMIPDNKEKKYDDNLNIVYDPGSSCMDCMTIAAILNSDQICYTSLSRMMMMMMIVVFDNDQCHTYLKMHLSFSMSSTIIFQRKKKRERGDSYYRYTF